MTITPCHVAQWCDDHDSAALRAFFEGHGEWSRGNVRAYHKYGVSPQDNAWPVHVQGRLRAVLYDDGHDRWCTHEEAKK